MHPVAQALGRECFCRHHRERGEQTWKRLGKDGDGGDDDDDEEAVGLRSGVLISQLPRCRCRRCRVKLALPHLADTFTHTGWAKRSGL